MNHVTKARHARAALPAAARPPAARAALAAVLLLGGCDTADLFAEIELPEAPGTAAAPYPRLVDTPTPPPPGVYTDAVPDPLEGVAIGAALGSASRAAAERAEALAAPVVPAPPRPRRGAAPDPSVDEAALAARAAAARERAERLAPPVLTEAERERLARAAR